jgi:hypothetical protein
MQKMLTKSWARRLGVVGFFVFFAKGLLWIILPLLMYKGCAAD